MNSLQIITNKIDNINTKIDNELTEIEGLKELIKQKELLVKAYEDQLKNIYDGLQELVEPEPITEITSELETVPITVPNKKIPKKIEIKKKEDPKIECYICGDSFEKKEYVPFGRCNHDIHVQCLIGMKESGRSVVCPLCRGSPYPSTNRILNDAYDHNTPIEDDLSIYNQETQDRIRSGTYIRYDNNRNNRTYRRNY